MTSLIGLYGGSGCSRRTILLFQEHYPNADLVFIDVAPAWEQVFGFDVIDWARFLNYKSFEKSVLIASAALNICESIAEKCATANIPLIEATTALVFQMDDVEIADSVCLSPFVAMSSNIQIDCCSRADLDTYIVQDCLISQFVTFALGAKANHNATTGRHGNIGSGSIFIRDVPPAITVVGNPATQINKD